MESVSPESANTALSKNRVLTVLSAAHTICCSLTAQGIAPDLAHIRTIKSVESLRYKTYSSALLCAIVARSVDSKIDARALMSDYPNGYNAAGVIKWTISWCLENGYHLEHTAAVPFNNSPFNGKRVIERSYANLRDPEAFGVLCDAIDSVHAMSKRSAQALLVSFLQHRLSVPKALYAPVPNSVLSIRSMVEAASEFANADPESGRRGQALVAALVESMLNVDVICERVNDPSRHAPGDVRALDSDGIYMCIEVKQRPVGPVDIRNFADSLRNHDIFRGLYLAMRGFEDVTSAVEHCAKEGIHITLLHGASDLSEVIQSLIPPRDLTLDSGAFGQSYLNWMQSLNCEPQSLTDWHSKMLLLAQSG